MQRWSCARRVDSRLPCPAGLGERPQVKTGASLDDIPREVCDNAARAVCDLMLTSSTSTLADTSTMPVGSSKCQEHQRG